VSIGPDIQGVARVNAALAHFADAHAVPAGVRRSMSIALDELLANTISYAFAHQAGEITADVALHADRLTLTLSDNGGAFDPFRRSAPDTTLSIEDRPIGGHGIHLVQQLMDDVTYQRHGDRNVVVLTKRLVAGRAGAAGHSGTEGEGGTMQITTRDQGGVGIVVIAGKLDSVTSPKAQQALEAMLAGGGRKMAVDFSALDYISSAGLRVLLGVAKQLAARGGALRTFGLNDTVREVFDISGFSTILAVFPNESDALNGF
jgi:anti-anti-sigma factor